ncbi:MAG TPA: helix-turn-helix domain-containing protein [Candidatus Binataceae bacterium]|nr:helix-turn-helix domain-containing protein [Candidatus Binataceae bacterium]
MKARTPRVDRRTPSHTVAEPDPKSHSGFVKRLKTVIRDAESILALAAKAGVSDSTIHLWLKDSEPSRKKLIDLAEAAGVSVEWLATGRGEMKADLVPEGYVVIDSTTNIGEPGKPKGELHGVAQLAFQLNLLRSLPGSPKPETLFLTHANGDAMAPTIQDSDLVLVNFADDRRMLRDGLYAVILLGPPPVFLIRRIQLEGTGSFHIICDNPVYMPYKMPIRAYADAIFSRVVWFARTLDG